MGFSEFFCIKEAKFREVPSNIEKEAERIADLYIDSVSKISNSTIKQLKRIGLPEDWKKYFEDEIVWFVVELTKTPFYDLKTKQEITATVYIAYGEKGEDYASYDSGNHVMFIYDEFCRNLNREKLVSTIVHEITHGFQEYKEPSKEYKKHLAKKTKSVAYYHAYYTQPIEFDAFSTEMGFSIKRKYEQLKNGMEQSQEPATKGLLKKRLERFLLEFKMFMQSPIETYLNFKELPIPSVISSFEEMFIKLKNNPEMLKILKLKMFHLYEKLTSSLKDENMS